MPALCLLRYMNKGKGILMRTWRVKQSLFKGKYSGHYRFSMFADIFSSTSKAVAMSRGQIPFAAAEYIRRLFRCTCRHICLAFWLIVSLTILLSCLSSTASKKPLRH